MLLEWGAHSSIDGHNVVLYCVQVEDVQKGKLTLAEYGLETASAKLDPTNEVVQYSNKRVLRKRTNLPTKDNPEYHCING